MTQNSYDLGSAVQLSANFADINGVPHAPTNVRLRVLDPTGTETIYTTFSTPSTGVYQFMLTVMIPGVWKYRYEGDGAVTAAQDAVFVVTSTPFADAMA